MKKILSFMEHMRRCRRGVAVWGGIMIGSAPLHFHAAIQGREAGSEVNITTDRADSEVEVEDLTVLESKQIIGPQGAKVTVCVLRHKGGDLYIRVELDSTGTIALGYRDLGKDVRASWNDPDDAPHNPDRIRDRRENNRTALDLYPVRTVQLLHVPEDEGDQRIWGWYSWHKELIFLESTVGDAISANFHVTLYLAAINEIQGTSDYAEMLRAFQKFLVEFDVDLVDD